MMSLIEALTPPALRATVQRPIISHVATIMAAASDDPIVPTGDDAQGGKDSPGFQLASVPEVEGGLAVAARAAKLVLMIPFALTRRRRSLPPN